MSEAVAGQGGTRKLPTAVVGAIYALFLLSGATALIFETLWTRQFVTVFGNSSYAVSCVLAAFMGGLGLGALWFGRAADRGRDHLLVFACLEAGIIVWALLLPTFISSLARLAPAMLNVTTNLAGLTAIRFVVSFVALFVPSFLMGGTLPVLTRFSVRSAGMVGRRVSLLYGLNTLGAAAGCFASGFYLLETLGMAGTNLAAVGVNTFIMLSALGLRRSGGAIETVADTEPASETERVAGTSGAGAPRVLLFAAFMSGFCVMALEVLWVRFLVFTIANNQYSFTAILVVVLTGLAVGSLLYRAFLARSANQMKWLAAIELLAGPVVIASLLTGAEVAMGDRHSSIVAGIVLSEGDTCFKAYSIWLVAATVFVPVSLLGVVFPLIAGAYAKRVDTVGRSLGRIYAVNTLGSIAGSLAPMLFMVTAFGTQKSIYLTAGLVTAVGLVVLLASGAKRRFLLSGGAAAAAAAAYAVLLELLPANLNQEVFFSDPVHEGSHNEVTFYREGRTATVMAIRDQIGDFEQVYIGRVLEVPTTYTGHIFFKVMGSLGPLLHEKPTEVLALCMGGGITAGTMTRHAEVERVICVDLVKEMAEASEELAAENNDLVADDKFEFVHQDARNFLLTSPRKYPVIVCDSTHPRSPDSWVLYTQEFYRTVRRALADDGVFVQWTPVDGLSVQEYQITMGTFQSVFPHTSAWFVAGYDETGGSWATSCLVATPDRLSIDLERMRDRLSRPAVKADLAHWDLDNVVGFLETFLCGEDRVREWTTGMPVNTDDLPYTLYRTRYAGGQPWDGSVLNQLAESPWAYLSNAGDDEEATALKSELDRHLAGRKAFLAGRMADAFAFASGCGKLAKIRSNLAEARDYLWKLADYYDGDAERLLAVARRYLSLLAVGEPARREDFERGLSIFERVLEVDPGNAEAHGWVGPALAEIGRLDEAVGHIVKSIELSPRDSAKYGLLATVLLKLSEDRQAVMALREGLRLAPTLDLANLLAWVLATSPDEGLRDGAEAVRLAEQVNRASGYKVAAGLDTLAAAYAEVGRFAEAAEAAGKALQAARAEGLEERAAEIEKRLKLYEKGQAHRTRQRAGRDGPPGQSPRPDEGRREAPVQY